MNFLKLTLISAAVALFVFACSQNQTTNLNVSNNTAAVANANNNPQSAAAVPTPDEFDIARKIYSAQCINCHKEDGKGGVSEIEGKRIKAPDFTSDRQKKEPDEEYIEIIEHGEIKDGMPAFKGKISNQEIKGLVKYIRREFQGKQL